MFRSILIIAALAVLPHAAHAAEETTFREALTRLEQDWTTTCLDYAEAGDPRKCVDDTHAAVNRMRETVGQTADMHFALKSLAFHAIRGCVDEMEADDIPTPRGVSSQSFLVECAIHVYETILKNHGGPAGFVEEYLRHKSESKEEDTQV